MPILHENPHGRLDIALVRATELLVRGPVESRLGLPVWDWGLGELAERFVVETLRVPSKAVTVVDAARLLGLLPTRGTEK